MRQAAAGRLLEPGVQQPGMGAPLDGEPQADLVTGRCGHCDGAHRDQHCRRKK